MKRASKLRHAIWGLGLSGVLACDHEPPAGLREQADGAVEASEREPDGGERELPEEREGGASPQTEGGSPEHAGFDGSTEADARAPEAGAARDGAMAPGPIENAGIVEETIVVGSGETFDGQGKRYVAGRELGDGSQSESQKPVFKLEAGARLVNVVLGAPAADGIHTYGDALLENIVWEDVGEDALTIKGPGTVVLDGGSAMSADDKVFQINAPSTFRVSNFRAAHGGKFIRQNGGTSFKVEVFIDRCDIAHMEEAIFRTDSDVSTLQMTNTRYSDIGKELFMGVAPANITLANNTAY